MECPICGADTEVISTTAAMPSVVRRMRVCPNNHRTSTAEFAVPRNLQSRTLLKHFENAAMAIDELAQVLETSRHLLRGVGEDYPVDKK